MNIEINYFAVFLAGLASMIVGFAWYGPILGKPWMKLKGYTPDSLKKSQKNMGALYGVSFVIALITAFVLSHVMGLSQNFYDYPPLQTGLITAFWMWLGFILPVQTTATIFSDEKSWALLAIDTGYQLASVLIMGVVIAVV